MAKRFNYPDEKTLKKMDRKLARVRPSRVIPPPDASPLYLLKSALCAQFIIYAREQDLSQKELAKEIGLSEARMSEILHYHHERFTSDLLTKYLSKIKPDLKISVA